jgi:glycerol-3-phosphate dehydrogenase (NAD(P)+)
MFGILGSGSWATALAKILTDNHHAIHWLVRSEAMVEAINKRKHNPNYLHSVVFDTSLLHLDTDVSKVVAASDYIIIATPSAYVVDTLKKLHKKDFEGKKVISAVKGIIPHNNSLLNDYLEKEFNVELRDYFTIMGPCHAEEVASEKLSYLTFSGADEETAA